MRGACRGAPAPRASQAVARSPGALDDQPRRLGAHSAAGPGATPVGRAAAARAVRVRRGDARRGSARSCVLLSLACFLPGFASLQPMDRDEPRFAQASKQMLETGDFVDIRFQDEARHKKPVGIYWLQSAAVALARPRRAGGAHDDRALPAALASRRARDRAPHLLGRARLPRPPRGVPRRGLHGGLHPPDGRGPARQDGRRARRLLRRRDGRARPRLSRAGAPAACSPPALSRSGRPSRSGSWSRARWS